MKTVPFSPPPVPASYLLLLRDYLHSSGTSLDEALCAASIAPERVREVDFALTPQQYEHLLAQIIRLTGRNDLGFEWGRRIRLNSHGILGYAMLSYATLDQGLRRSAHYFPLLSPLFSMSYQRRSDLAEIIFRPVQPMGALLLETSLELLAVATYLQNKPLLRDPDCPCDIYLSIHRPQHAQRYRELGPVRVHFSASPAPAVRMDISHWSLDAQLPTASEHAVRTAEERCDALLQARGRTASWTAWVMMMLEAAEDARPTLELLASSLGLSSRTLDRRLRKEGSSFRDLAIEVRNARALRLLEDNKLPVSEIAYRLGFTDVANFSRAFRKLNGVSPSLYRDSVGAPDSAGSFNVD